MISPFKYVAPSIPKQAKAKVATRTTSEHLWKPKAPALRRSGVTQGLLPGFTDEYKAPGATVAATQAIPLWLLLDTGWRRPDVFPDLRDSQVVSFDIETYDPHLRQRSKGPGFIRGDASILGVAVVARAHNGERFKGYYPIRHQEESQDNFDETKVFDWLKENLNSAVPKIGANIPYDIEGLRMDGDIRITGPLWDIQNAEGILDEESACVTSLAHRGFRLDKLGYKYLGRGKDESALAALGIKDVKGRMRELPPRAVGSYAEMDADLTLDVWDMQRKEITRQNLDYIWQLECDILPYLLEMRFRGVRVDLEQAERVEKELRAEHLRMLDGLMAMAGFAVDPNKKEDLSRLCQATGITPLTTDKGNDSFTKKWLNAQEHPAFKTVVECRQMEKMFRDFVHGMIMEQNVKGRIHSQFHQLKRSSAGGDGDEDGTRSGRFSSTNPNLQQVPKRDGRFALLIRSLFLPDEGGEWLCGDYSAQEPRLLAHYAGRMAQGGHFSEAATKSALDLVEAYRTNPKLDYHQKVAEMAQVDRNGVAKPLNLALTYGAGKRKAALTTGWITMAEYRNRDFKLPDNIEQLFTKYHAGVPFLKELQKLCESRASTRGYIKTLQGRRRHFDLWVPRSMRHSEGFSAPEPLPRALAMLEWTDEPLVRAETNKALNAVIQGSAADMGKEALRTMGRAGLIPQLMVHDEFDVTVHEPSEAQLVHDAMINAVKILVPVLVDMGVGASWAAAASGDGKKRAKEMGIDG